MGPDSSLTQALKRWKYDGLVTVNEMKETDKTTKKKEKKKKKKRERRTLPSSIKN